MDYYNPFKEDYIKIISDINLAKESFFGITSDPALKTAF